MKTITATRQGWTATYSGGCYIDLSIMGHTVEVINILDYSTGEYRMEPTRKALARELETWLEENKGNLDCYFEHARYL